MKDPSATLTEVEDITICTLVETGRKRLDYGEGQTARYIMTRMNIENAARGDQQMRYMGCVNSVTGVRWYDLDRVLARDDSICVMEKSIDKDETDHSSEPALSCESYNDTTLRYAPDELVQPGNTIYVLKESQ